MKSELKNAIDVIVKEMKKCHSNIDGYAWVCIGSTDPPKDPYPFVDGWIMADFNVITCVDNNTWFRSEMESLLEEMFVPDLSLDYLVAFVFDSGDSSVGIFPGYNCQLVLDENSNPITRRFSNED